jgi:predicted nucleic acid-binding protein
VLLTECPLCDTRQGAGSGPGRPDTARAALDLVLVTAHAFPPAALDGRICTDPDDDKFLACALASGAATIVSGDKHLVAVSGYRGIEVLRPRAFVDRYLAR